MVSEQPYKSLKHTLQQLKLQVEDSLPYIGDYIPDRITTPKQLFYYLKSITKYKKDPNGIELLQMAHTLLERNGRGDCDCFTILALAACDELGFGPLYVTIVGNSRLSPSHIYPEVYDEEKGRICVFDLTNPKYDMERPYKFKQRLSFNL